tara:strand:- start:428 stop:763 length:336 start_codon:yes stop_codon:yes gene_type:complete
MELAYTEIWDSDRHGYNRQQTINPDGHILLLENVYNINDHIYECTYDPLVSHFLKHNINIVKRYSIGDYTFAIHYTFYLKMFQKKFRKWLQKRRQLSSMKSLLNRQIYGKF